MKTIKDLKQFYNTTLLNDLNFLEEKRKKIAQKLVFIGIALLCVMGVLFFLLQRYLEMVFGPLILAIVLYFAICFVACNLFSKNYVREFRDKIISTMIKFADKNLSYSQSGYIPQSIYEASQIFKRHAEFYKNRPFFLRRAVGYSGKNLVSGKMGAIQFDFSEIKTKIYTQRGQFTIFSGLFFVGKFNKSFAGRTIVIPRKDVQENYLLGTAGKILQPWNRSRDPAIKLDYPEFEEFFVTHGDNPTHTRHLLQTALMRKIIDFKKKREKHFFISFVGPRVFVAVSYHQDIFEPRLFGTVLDFELVQSYFEDLQFVVEIIDELNSKTRIWSVE